MRNALLVAVVAMSLAGVGCQDGRMPWDKKDKDPATTQPSGDPKRMSTDACPHCPGVQTATEAGKCPKCGMQVKG